MDGPGTVRVTPVYGDTLTWGVGGWGGLAVAIQGWSGDCQGNSSVRGYCEIGEAIHVLPWTIRVTPVYGDTLT